VYRSAVVVAVVLAPLTWLLESPAALDVIDEKAVAALTGVSTPETEILDKEVARLLEQYDALQAKYRAESSSFSRAPGADLKKQSSDLQQLYRQSVEVQKQALERANEAGDKRALAAVEQRCVAASQHQSSMPKDTAASTYLCSAVRIGGAKSGPNEPWDVCSCVRQYVLGARQEIDDLHTRARQFIGQHAVQNGPMTFSFDQMKRFVHEKSYPKPYAITVDDVSSAFEPAQNVSVDRLTSNSPGGFGWAAQKTQRNLARSRVLRHDPAQSNNPPAPFRDKADIDAAQLYPAKRFAYNDVQDAIRRLWWLHQKEALFQLMVLQETVVDRQRQARAAFITKAGVLENRLELGWQPDPALVAETKNLCERSDRDEARFVDETVNRVRAIVSHLKDVRRRLMHDGDAWKTFGDKDGAGGGNEAGIWNYPDKNFAKFIETTFAIEGNSVQNVEFLIPVGRTVPRTALFRRGWVEFTRPECIEFNYLDPQLGVGYPTPLPLRVIDNGTGHPVYAIADQQIGLAQQQMTEDQEKAVIAEYVGRLRLAMRKRYPETAGIDSFLDPPSMPLNYLIASETDLHPDRRTRAVITVRTAQGGRFPANGP
jgi:hypothetical protein